MCCRWLCCKVRDVVMDEWCCVGMVLCRNGVVLEWCCVGMALCCVTLSRVTLFTVTIRGRIDLTKHRAASLSDQLILFLNVLWNTDALKGLKLGSNWNWNKCFRFLWLFLIQNIFLFTWLVTTMKSAIQKGGFANYYPIEIHSRITTPGLGFYSWILYYTIAP